MSKVSKKVSKTRTPDETLLRLLRDKCPVTLAWAAQRPEVIAFAKAHGIRIKRVKVTEPKERKPKSAPYKRIGHHENIGLFSAERVCAISRP